MKALVCALRLVDRYLEQTFIVVLFSTLILCLTYSTFVRYFVTNPLFTSLTHKAEELAVFAFIWLLYWGAAFATKEKAHFRIHAHFALFPESWWRWQHLPGDLLWLAFNLFIIWQGMVLVRSAIVNPETSLSLEIPMAIIYSAIPATFVVTAFRMIQNFARVDEGTQRHDTTAVH